MSGEDVPRNTRPSAAREKVIRDRQDPPRWGRDYIPGQLATKAEAPDETRPGTIYSYSLKRDIHVMSNPERHACLLGLFAEFADELHEGRMLRPEPGPGPLSGYGPAEGLPIVLQRGTIEVSDSLGLLKWHPRVTVPDKNQPNRKVTIAFPMLGDLLWYVPTPPPPRCINWTVRAAPEDFELPFSGKWPSRTPKPEDIEAAKARALVEEVDYADASVPTLRVVESEIPWHLRHNLRFLYKMLRHDCTLDEGLRADFIGQMRIRLDKDVPPIETIIAFGGRYGGAMEEYRAALFHAIWRKELRVDLLTPISTDAPLRPTTADIGQLFAHWFNPPRI